MLCFHESMRITYLSEFRIEDSSAWTLLTAPCDKLTINFPVKLDDPSNVAMDIMSSHGLNRLTGKVLSRIIVFLSRFGVGIIEIRKLCSWLRHPSTLTWEPPAL